jgi:hypothetical protein
VKLPSSIMPKAAFTSSGGSQSTGKALQRPDETLNGPTGDFFGPVPADLELAPPLLAPEKSRGLGLKEEKTWLISL